MCNEKGDRYIVLRVSPEMQQISALQAFQDAMNLAPQASEEQTVEAVKQVYATIASMKASLK